MGLIVMIAGLAVFLGTHLVTTHRDLRAALIARYGASAYKVAYSVLSAIGLVLIVYGFSKYRATGWINVWYPPVGMRHLALALMLPATIIFASAYLRGHIWRFMKHPMLVAIKIWALAHLLANGDLGSIILFGSFLAWAVFDRITLKSREDAGQPADPVRRRAERRAGRRRWLCGLRRAGVRVPSCRDRRSRRRSLSDVRADCRQARHRA